MEIPAPPTDANVDEMHRFLLSLYNWLKSLHLEGLQATQFKTSEINAMTQLPQGSKIVFDTDVGKFKFLEISGGAVVVKELP